MYNMKRKASYPANSLLHFTLYRGNFDYTLLITGIKRITQAIAQKGEAEHG